MSTSWRASWRRALLIGPLGVLLALGTSRPLLAGEGKAARAQPVLDPEQERVRLIERLERSVVLVLAEGKEISHEEKLVRLSPSEWLGTGILIHRDGLVLTAAHVVSAAESLRVKVEDREPLPARVVFADDDFDVALVRVDSLTPPPVVTVSLGDSDAVKKGQTVYVIGNPSGMERSLSVGVVSGKHPATHVFGGNLKAELIQTDAAINSGNSGGPIFNSRGEVIALAQSILTAGGGSEGLGFGLAINTVKKILGLEPTSWLGFSSVPLDAQWAAALNVSEPGALLVQRVVPSGPSDRAGLRGGTIPVQAGRAHLLLGGDVILKIGSFTPLEWTTAKSASHTGPLVVLVRREGRNVELPITPISGPRW